MRAAPAASRKIHLEPLRIAVVTVIPTPYRDPFWRVFERNEEVELTVFYCAGGKKDRPWTVDWGQPNHACYLKGYNLAAAFGAATSLYWNPEIRKRPRDKPYDGIIVGGLQPLHHVVGHVVRPSERNTLLLKQRVLSSTKAVLVETVD